jgi:RNA polymerase sigma-70 factor (ECF subfamily)
MEREEISELYLRLGPLVYRRCLRLLANPENARDATQEVFVRALRHVSELTHDRECLPWLYRVATNYCLNRLRDGRPLEFREPEAMPEPPRSAGAPSGADDRLAARRTVMALLNRLDEQTAEIAVHAFLDDMTQDEIAEVMGLSRRTVGKKLKRFEEQAAVFGREQLP